MAETNKPLPAPEQTDKGLPQIGSPENSVRIGDQLIEIRPTKLKYQRNRTAAFYRMLELYPLADILAMEAGAFGDDRDLPRPLIDSFFLQIFTPDHLYVKEPPQNRQK